MDANKQIALIRGIRSDFQQVIQDLTIEQLNTIPPGFNNNIAWNYAHSIATQQSLCYSMMGLPAYLDIEVLKQYRRGTKPGEEMTAAELEKWHGYADSLLTKLAEDVEQGLFEGKTATFNRLGVEITTFEEMLAFNYFHEGTHLGYTMALKRALLG
jgi:hypothetical protein